MLIWLATRLWQHSGILRRSPPKSLSHLAAQYPPAYLPAYFSSVAGCSILLFSDCFRGLIAGPFEASNCFADHLEHLPEFGVFFFFCHLGRLFQFLLPLLICFFCFGFFLFFQFFFLLPFGFLVKFLLLFLIDRPLTW